MRFLFAKAEPREAQRVLVVQTANADLFLHVLRAVRERFPAAELTALIQKGMRENLPEILPVEKACLNDPAHRRELLAALRAARFDVVCLIESGESGYWKLKLLPVLLRPRAAYVYDRRAAARLLSLAAAPVLLWSRRKSRPLLTSRRLAAPVILFQCWRFYRRRRTQRISALKGEGAHRLDGLPPR